MCNAILGRDTNIKKEELHKELKKEWLQPNTDDGSNICDLIIDDEYFWFGAKPNVPAQGDTQVKKELKQVLHLTLFEMDMKINVTQEAKNHVFTIDCANIVVNGKYRRGGELNYTHNIELTLFAPMDLKDVGMADKSTPYTLRGSTIHVYSEKRKGIYFEFKEEIIDEGAQKTV